MAVAVIAALVIMLITRYYAAVRADSARGVLSEELGLPSDDAARIKEQAEAYDLETHRMLMEHEKSKKEDGGER